MAELFKIDILDVQSAIERAFFKVLGEKNLNYDKLAFLSGDDITGRAIKSYAIEGNIPPLTKAILIAKGLDEFKIGLGAAFLDEILKPIGYKVIPFNKSNDNKLFEHLEIVLEAHRKGVFDEMKAMN